MRHFARHPLQGLLAGRGPHAPLAQELAVPLQALAAETAEAALHRLRTRPEGLSPREAAARRARHGPNVVAHAGPPPWWIHLAHCFSDPFNLLLTALACVAALTADARAAAVIAVMVALSTAIRYVQERRSVLAVESLQALVGNTATVRRSGSLQELPVSALVPGDIVQLSAGDMVPADARLLQARDLFVAQSALTGEALPVEKLAMPREALAAAPAAAPGAVPPVSDVMACANLVFMGTSVVSGTATAVVAHTGARTAFGALAAHASAADNGPDALQAGLNGVSWLLIRMALVMAPLVLLVNGLTKGDWLEATLFALAVAVGLTPEMLPVVVTSTLAQGALHLARRKVVVKRLDAIQTLGAMDLLCVDKTGTLTQDRVALARHVDALGQPSPQVLTLAWLNSHHQTGLRNLLDRAILSRVDPAQAQRLQQQWRKVDEIPFDFERRRMSVVLEGGEGRAPMLVCKGGVQEVLSACSRVRLTPAQATAGKAMSSGDAAAPPGQGASAVPVEYSVEALVDVPLDAPLRERVRAVAAALADGGLRVVSVAVRELPPGPGLEPGAGAPGLGDERDLVLVGHVAFLDPPKDSAALALASLAAHGVEVKVLTGDHERVAAHVCREVGLADGPVLTGEQVRALDDAALAEAAAAHPVCARLAPLDKERIVRALRARGRVVGFLGDGINDAPALRAADVGLAVDSGTDIAREAADVVLLDRSLQVVDDGVVEGRRTFCNLLKYVRMAASSNFGNVLSVIAASAFLPFLPMQPLHLLVQNLLYDIAQTGVPFDHVEPDQLHKPLAWQPGTLRRFILCFGPVSSVIDLAAFAVLWFGLQASTVAQQVLFQSGWFVVGLLTQTLVVQLIRSPGLPGAHDRPSAVLVASTALVVVAGLWLPMGALAPLIGLQALPGVFFAWLAVLLLAYVGLVSAVKRLYVRRFGWP